MKEHLWEEIATLENLNLHLYIHYIITFILKIFFWSYKSTVILNMSWLQTDDIKSEGIMTEALKSLLVLLIGKISIGQLFITINI